LARYLLTAECHVVSYPEHDEPAAIAYFPLKSLALRVNQAGVELLERLQAGPIVADAGEDLAFLEHLAGLGLVNGPPDVLPGGEPPPEPCPTRTMLLVSDRCSLSCVYCYRSASDRGDLMSREVALAAVDLLVENAVAGGQGGIDVSFHGGGEPTLNWEVLTAAMDHAQTRCVEHGLGLSSSICTNGVLGEERTRWLAEHVANIVVSVDGPPELQDAQRPLVGGGPSFPAVARTLDQLRALGKPYALRTTATALSEGRLPEIFRFLVERFHPRTICLEPLFVCGRCHTSRCSPPVAERFTDDLLRAMQLARRAGVSLQYSGGRLFYMDRIFCGASGRNFFVTPRGEVTSCLEVSCGEDPRASVFFYGRHDATSGGFVFDLERYRALGRAQVQEYATCKQCFARWHCAGDCPAKVPDVTRLGEVTNAYRCQVNRAVTRHQIFVELSRREAPARGAEGREPETPSVEGADG